MPPTEEGLNSLLSEHDEMVWKISQKNYTQSRHKVEFSTVRDVIDSRIEVLKEHVAKEKAEEERRLAMEAEQKAEVDKKRQIRLAELARELDESGRDKNLSDLFLKVQDVVSEQLKCPQMK